MAQINHTLDITSGETALNSPARLLIRAAHNRNSGTDCPREDEIRMDLLCLITVRLKMLQRQTPDMETDTCKTVIKNNTQYYLLRTLFSQ